MLYLICNTISRVHHARHEVPYAQELGTCIWGPCYNSTLYATGINVICTTEKNIYPRCDSKSRHLTLYVRRVNVLAVEATQQTLREICKYTVFYMRGIQAFQGDVLLSPTCRISYFSLPGVHYNRYTLFCLGISGGGVFP